MSELLEPRLLEDSGDQPLRPESVVHETSVAYTSCFQAGRSCSAKSDSRMFEIENRQA